MQTSDIYHSIWFIVHWQIRDEAAVFRPLSCRSFASDVYSGDFCISRACCQDNPSA